MARNPLYNDGRTDAQNNGLTHDNKASNPNKKYSQGMNTFNNSYKFANTERFADVTPFMYLDCLSRDKIPFKSRHKLSSYTLQSPMMDEIYKHKFYSLVPYKAILPNTWELFYTNPTKGDDVPDDVYCNVNLVRKYLDFLITSLGEIPEGMETVYSCSKAILATEMIFSTGSLLSVLKYNLWPHFYIDNAHNIDVFFDTKFVPWFKKYATLSVEIQPEFWEPIVCDPSANTSGLARLVSVHTFLDYIREGNYHSLSFAAGKEDEMIESFSPIAEEFSEVYIQNFFKSVGLTQEDLGPDGSVEVLEKVGYDVDLSAVIAYQITCVSQVTDASIDYLFNANLFRNVLFPIPNIESFSYNGQYFVYETFSKRYLDNVWFNPNNFLDTCQKLFSFAKSLKFGDYFTQMRPQRTAVGDLEIDTSDGLDALEITRKMVYQRFLNWNNRVGPKYEDYIKELTGMSPLPDATEPSLITHTKETVGSYEVENTGEAQLVDSNSVTTLLRQTSGGFAFDILVSEPCILLGLTSYDMQRLYTRVMDRSHLKQDRFDFFNHMLQYTGDQDIKASELDATRKPDIPIGYNTKDIHYKMQVSTACGGFITSLPSWAFTTENTDNDMSLYFGINPNFIRNTNGDFDRFFSSLSGYSLGTYFHFILKYDNDFSDMQRAMDVAPDIL